MCDSVKVNRVLNLIYRTVQVSFVPIKQSYKVVFLHSILSKNKNQAHVYVSSIFATVQYICSEKQT